MKLKGIMATAIAMLAIAPMMADECDECPSNGFLDCLCDPCSDWSFEADWLFWHLRRSGLDYAIVGKDSNSLPSGEVKKLEPDWDSGIRLALFKDCGILDVGLRYIGFCTEDHKQLNRTSQDDIFVTRLHPATGGINIVEFAKSRFKLDFDEVDLEFGSRQNLSCICGFVRPFAGIKFTYIDQHMKTVYDENPNGTGAAALVREKDDISAIGLYGGMDGEWNDIWCGLGLFGRTSFTLSAAGFERRFAQYDDTDQVLGALQYFVKEDKWLLVPSFEAAIGLQYHLCDFQCIDWTVKLGYEFQWWCDSLDFINFVGSQNELGRAKTNIGFDGIFLRIAGIY